MAGNEAAYIAPTARVDPGAAIGSGTRIGEYCVIEADVVVGANCVLEPYVYIKRWTTLGDDNEISAGAALGTDPLDKAFAAICALAIRTKSASTSPFRAALNLNRKRELAMETSS
jgi:acyl-[acyl carrier protein]--UDP-N-acetylglucosamine O-acyltransferase